MVDQMIIIRRGNTIGIGEINFPPCAIMSLSSLNRPDYYERSPPPYNRGHRGHELSPPPPHKGHWGHDCSPPPSHSPSRVPRNVRPRSPWQQQQDPSPWRSEGNVQEETTKEKMILDVSLAPPPPPYPGPHPITPTAHEEESTSEGEGGRKNQWKPLDLNEVLRAKRSHRTNC